MDDFLGTSIQYSEQQILRLEREHAAEKERIVNELIDNGFLDSDYESTESSYEESTDCEINYPITETISNHVAIEENTEENAVCQLSETLPISAVDEDEFIENELSLATTNEESMELSDGLLYLFEMVLSTTMDLKAFLILCIMAIALPHCIERGSDIYGGIEYENDAQSETSHYVRKTVWICSSSPTLNIKEAADTAADGNEEDDDDDDDIEHTLINLDIMTTTLDTQTNKMFAELERHRFKITPNDLLCGNDLNEYRPASAQLPPLLLSFGAGFDLKNNGGMMRVFKETLSDPVGRQFLRSHGVLSLIMSFAGIAAFAASGSIAVE